jgi:hypothetical protein
LIKAFDKPWPANAVTELKAFEQVTINLPESDQYLYLAYPWAELFLNQLINNEDYSELIGFISKLVKAERTPQKIITVCDTHNFSQLISLFEEIGLTDIFWPQANATNLPNSCSFKIHPFPFYVDEQKSHLKNKIQLENYGTDLNLFIQNEKLLKSPSIFSPFTCRNIELTKLSPEDIIDFESNRYEKKNVFDESQYPQISSLFIFCPSDNKDGIEWVWRAIEFGAIPVIEAGFHLLPGNIALWNNACVFFNTNELDILPNRLKELVQNSSQIETKKQTLMQLHYLFGNVNLIGDIENLILNLRVTEAHIINKFWQTLFNDVNFEQNLVTARLFLTSFISHFLLRKEIILSDEFVWAFKTSVKLTGKTDLAKRADTLFKEFIRRSRE